MNLALAARLALRSLSRHPVVTLATLAGVALGMMAAGTILVVDHNSSDSLARFYESRAALTLLPSRKRRRSSSRSAAWW